MKQYQSAHSHKVFLKIYQTCKKELKHLQWDWEQRRNQNQIIEEAKNINLVGWTFLKIFDPKCLYAFISLSDSKTYGAVNPSYVYGS